MKAWFSIDKIDYNTHILSEYRHWEETHCYLLEGEESALLIDTGLGISNISSEVKKLTDKPVAVVATHIHWDHIGGHKYYPVFYAHEVERHWLNGKFPLSIEAIRKMIVDRCDLPENYDVEDYELFQGTPSHLLHDGEILDLGGRTLMVLHTPGHSPGHMCFFEKIRGIFLPETLSIRARYSQIIPLPTHKRILAVLKRLLACQQRGYFLHIIPWIYSLKLLSVCETPYVCSTPKANCITEVASLIMEIGRLFCKYIIVL